MAILRNNRLWRRVAAQATTALALQSLLFVAGLSARAQTQDAAGSSSAQAGAATAQTAAGPSAQGDLTQLSIENLMDVQVTSASKTEQKLSRVAAAIFVITQEDIRRSGATNIPDLLRIVPGVNVAEINGSTWAIGVRDFNEQLNNKLQVMVDGRSVYSPTFSGVFWDTLDIPLADIDRIEVIRGPGGSIWGANAVLGVISIFTKKAADTKGAFVEAGGGESLQGFGMVQYGGDLGKATDYRVYAQYFNQNHMLDQTGQSGDDGWHRLREGFRSDSTLSPNDSLTVEGDISTGREGELGFELPAITSPGFIAVPEEISLADGAVEAIWNHTYSGGSDSSLQLSYSQHRRDDPLNPEIRNTYSVDFQQHLALGDRQNIVWGVDYSDSQDQIGGSLTVAFVPPSRSLQLFGGFAQDEIALVQQRLYLTVGARLEHNDYTGFGLMPNIRATWAASDRHMFWAAVSRALRTPSRNDTNLVLNIGDIAPPGDPPILLRLLGNPAYQNERMVAYEAGYRTMPLKRLSIDVNAYFDDWHGLQTTEPSTSFFQPTPPPGFEVQTLMYENLMYGETHGYEISANWKATEHWSLSTGFTFENQHMHTAPQSLDTMTAAFVEGSTPDYMWNIRSHYNVRRTVAWDLSAYYVDALTKQGPLVNVKIPAYTRLDTGLTWRIREGLSAGIVGQNLLKDHHMEFEDMNGVMQSGEIKRSAYAKITWQF
jgi:iron complex outermembrane recepter protein